jgi:hypothetical protein
MGLVEEYKEKTTKMKNARPVYQPFINIVKLKKGGWVVV